jgi:hypothetical protein
MCQNNSTLITPRVDQVNEQANVFVVQTKGETGLSTEQVAVNINLPNDSLPTYDQIVANQPEQNR